MNGHLPIHGSPSSLVNTDGFTVSKTTSATPPAPSSRLEFNPVPHLCQIETTYGCNQNCLGCYNPSREVTKDFTVLDSIVDSVAESQIPHTYLIGGEPSLLPVYKLNQYIEKLSPHSSVTIVTNGKIRLEGISPKLACFGIPIHGSNAKTHEYFSQSKGGFKTTIDNIKYYINQGFDVRCIPVLTGYNYDQMYDIIALAANLGMESIYVDRYEDGGIGAKNSNEFRGLKPTPEQFRIAVGQIIQARHDFPILKGKVGFGTAIPYCLDSRILEEGIQSNCGVGTYFCVLSPTGSFRICNQSQLSFGNVPQESVETIWNKRAIDVFRCLSWVEEPCKSCPLLCECVCGCKVDVNCSDKFCIDYAARNTTGLQPGQLEKIKRPTLIVTYPEKARVFRINRYTKITTKHAIPLLVTRYQTVELDETVLNIINTMMAESIINENHLIERFATEVDSEDIRAFVSQLIQVEAIDVIGEV